MIPNVPIKGVAHLVHEAYQYVELWFVNIWKESVSKEIKFEFPVVLNFNTKK